MAIAFVQSAAAIAAGVPVVKAFDSPVAAGNLLVGAVYIRNDTDTVTFADDQSNTWNAIGSPTLDGDNDRRGQMFYAMNTAAGATTVTVTQSGTTNLNVAFGEWSGIATTSAFGTHAYLGVTGDLTPSTDTINTSQSEELLVAFCATHSEVTVVDSPFTMRELADFNSNGFADAVVSNGSHSATFSINAAVACIMGIASFVPPASAGGGVYWIGA